MEISIDHRFSSVPFENNVSPLSTSPLQRRALSSDPHLPPAHVIFSRERSPLGAQVAEVAVRSSAAFCTREFRPQKFRAYKSGSGDIRHLSHDKAESKRGLFFLPASA